MRALPALLAVILLAGCGKGAGADDAFVDSRIPPALERRFYPPEGWAWGLVKIGEAPPVRYGVAGPATQPKGDILIACGYGESAEDWFETANTLVALGYAVWIMDAAGQGGSGRFAHPRDLGHDPDFVVEAAALGAMTRIVRRPAVLIAQSTAAPSALAALADGLPVRSLVLSAPVFDATEAPVRAGAAMPAAAGMSRARLGWLRAVGQDPWKRADPLPRGRTGVIAAWQAANPDLRMGGVSYGWIAAFERQAKALGPQRLAAIKAPVLILRRPGGSGRAAAACKAMSACTVLTLAAGRGSLHLEGDAVYGPWSRAVMEALAPPSLPSD